MAHPLSLQQVAAALLNQLFHVPIACLAFTAATTNQLRETSHEYHEMANATGHHTELMPVVCCCA